jgi:hypothetical protein
MYVSSGAVLALNTGSTAPQLGQACEGGVVELLTNSSNRLRKGDEPSEAMAVSRDAPAERSDGGIAKRPSRSVWPSQGGGN